MKTTPPSNLRYIFAERALMDKWKNYNKFATPPLIWTRHRRSANPINYSFRILGATSTLQLAGENAPLHLNERHQINFMAFFIQEPEKIHWTPLAQQKTQKSQAHQAFAPWSMVVKNVIDLIFDTPCTDLAAVVFHLAPIGILLSNYLFDNCARSRTRWSWSHLVMNFTGDMTSWSNFLQRINFAPKGQAIALCKRVEMIVLHFCCVGVRDSSFHDYMCQEGGLIS